jgi:hypothetical protein
MTYPYAGIYNGGTEPLTDAAVAVEDAFGAWSRSQYVKGRTDYHETASDARHMQRTLARYRLDRRNADLGTTD